MPPKNPDELLADAVESARNIKFGRGVVSKTSYVAGLVVATWIVIAWQWTGDIRADGGLLIAGAAATVFGGWYIRSTQRFAERNPAQALLEGSELLEWQRLEIAAKGVPAGENVPRVEDAGGLPPAIEGRAK